MQNKSLNQTIQPASQPNVAAMTPARTTAIVCLLSRWICNRPVPGSNVHSLGIALELYARTPAGGTPAPLGTDFRSSVRPPDHNKAFRTLGTSAPALKSQWQSAARSLPVGQQDQASLPASTVEQFVPRDLWPAAAALIDDGPQLASMRMNQALADKAQLPANNSRREPGTISVGWLKQLIAATRKLVVQAMDIHTHPSGMFSQWTVKPSFEMPETATPRPQNLTPPTVMQVRKATKRIHSAARERLGLEPLTGAYDDQERARETTAVAQLAEWRLKRGTFTALRAWAFLTVLTCTGSRIDALLRLDQGSFRASATTGFGTGPTLIVYPMKGESRQKISKKPLSNVAHPIRIWIAYLERLHGGPLPEHFPLFPSRPSDLSKRWTYSAAYGWCVGRDGREPVVAMSEVPGSLGAAPHRFRATASTELDHPPVKKVMARHRYTWPQRFLSEVLLDHSFESNVEMVYKLTPDVCDQMSGVAIQALWEMFTTDLGARKGPDSERYRATLHRVFSERSAIDDLNRKARRLRDKASLAQIDMKEYVPRSEEIHDQLMKAERALPRLELLIERFESGDKALYRAFDDDVPDEATRVDLTEIRAEVEGEIEDKAMDAPQRLRDWITFEEFAQVAGVKGSKSVRDWVDPNKATMPPGLRPWLTPQAPIDAPSKNKRRLLVEHLNPNWLSEHPERNAQLEAFISEWPTEGFWRDNRDAHAPVPEWLLPSSEEDVQAA